MTRVSPPIVPILLYGPLRARFGRRFDLAVRSPREAVKALMAQVPGFKAAILSHKRGFSIWTGTQNLGEDELSTEAAGRAIRICPVLSGGGGSSPWYKVVLGAVLVVVGVVVNIYSTGGASPIGNALIASGVSLIVGGVCELLFKPPVPDGPLDKPENKPSTTFGGPVNTLAQGHPAPVLLGGPLLVGSAVLSGGIVVDERGSVFGDSWTGTPSTGAGKTGSDGNWRRRTPTYYELAEI